MWRKSHGYNNKSGECIVCWKKDTSHHIAVSPRRKEASIIENSFTTPIVCPTLIGRVLDLAALHLLLNQTKSGSGVVALVCGEAGIGKSRLVGEAKIYAADAGFLLLQGNCFPRDRFLPYAPLRDLLRTLFAQHDPLLADNMPPFAHALSPLVPDLLAPPPDLASRPALEPEQEKQQLFTALTRLLTDQALHQPILLFIEDLHWCDDISLEFFHALARQCTDRRLFLLGTYRSDDVPPHLSQWLTDLNRERLTRELFLTCLSRIEVDTMLRTLFTLRASQQAELLDTLYPLAEGNPFYLEEILTSMLTTHELSSEEGRWVYLPLQTGRVLRAHIPRTIQDTVQQRITHLSSSAQQVLTFTAVVDQHVDFTLLLLLMDCDELQLLASLKELIAAQFLVEQAADRFAFRHALFQQAVSTALLARERMILHRHVAQVLEVLYPSPSQREAHLAELAFHSYEAGLWSKALEYEQRVGEQATALSAPRAAIVHLTHALDAAHQLSLEPPTSIYHTRGRAYETLGEFDLARSDYERALEVARRTHDHTMEWTCALALGFLWTGLDYAKAGSWFHLAQKLADGLANPTVHARNLNRQGNWLVNLGHTEEGLRAHHEALALFTRASDTQGMADTLDLLGMGHRIAGDLVQALTYSEQATALFRTLGDTSGLINSLTTQSIRWTEETIFSALRRPETCLGDLNEARALAQSLSSLPALAWIELAAGSVEATAGNFSPAMRHIQEAQRIAMDIGHQLWIVLASCGSGYLFLLMLDSVQAIHAFKPALHLAQQLHATEWSKHLTAYLAESYLLNHEEEQARPLLMAAMPQEQLPRLVPERHFSWIWGKLALAGGEPERALQIAQDLLDSAPGTIPGQPQQPIPLLLHLKGEALTALSRLNEARSTLEDAQQGAQERHDPSILWRVHRSLGEVYHLLNQEEREQQAYTAAREIITTLATTIDERSLREHFVRTAFASLPEEKQRLSRQSIRQAPGGLTAREREVALLIVQGKTSREIADLLKVSERTAESHTSNILGKLGFTSRAQIAAWTVAQELPKA
jgi:DNA-binding CsgD family transcriptional regulator